jgi:Dullard-like phosphatase family protein
MNSTAQKVAHTVFKRAPSARSANLLERFPKCDFPASLPSQLPEDQGKLTVVLDIDETLIHTDMHGALEMQVKNNSEASLDDIKQAGKMTTDCFHINLDGFRLKVFKRPHLEWFLKEASSKFELITFTAGEKHYGSKILANIDPEQKLIRHRLFRHNCTQLGDHLYTKDLKDLNRPLHRIVLVDNNPICFLPQPENGVPVASFYSQQEDTTLQTLMSFLDHLNGKVDVRPVLKEAFRLPERLVRFYPAMYTSVSNATATAPQTVPAAASAKL